MPGKAKKAKTNVRAAPYTTKPEEKPLVRARARNFSIGQDLQPKRDVTRFVRWPKYVRLQRQRRVLNKRLRVPPPVNQFTKTLDKATASNLFRFLAKYRPEDKKEKIERLKKEAKEGPGDKSKPYVVKYGLNHVTGLIEQKKAQLVVIAHDVDPIELVIWLPALCRKFDVPYAIVKCKGRLGALVHKKTASCLALTRVKNEDKQAFFALANAVRDTHNAKFEENRRTWGGGIVGVKSQAKFDARRKKAEKEELQKLAAGAR